jgi:hypothetical protein
MFKTESNWFVFFDEALNPHHERFEIPIVILIVLFETFIVVPVILQFKLITINISAEAIVENIVFLDKWPGC